MPIVLNENAQNVNLLITILDDDGNGITGITHDDADLAIFYFNESASSWVLLSLTEGTLGSWTSNGFIECSDEDISSEGEYILGLPNNAISARKSLLLKVVYGTNKPLRDIVSFTGPPAFPNNFSTMQISNDGKLNINLTSLRLMLTIPSIATSLTGNFRVFIKETNRTLTFTANQNIESTDIKFVFENDGGEDLAIVSNEDLTKSGNTVSFTLPSEVTDTIGLIRWSARHETDNTLFGQDEFEVEYAPYTDEP
jgi:hypothetical protein